MWLFPLPSAGQRAIIILKAGGAVAKEKQPEKAQKSHNIHDKGYKALLRNKKVFLELIKTFATQDWISDLDEEHLIAVEKSFIPKDFRERKADILYRLQKNDLDIYFYILLELQSTVDFSMPIRLMSYICEIWRMELKNTPKDKIELKDFRLPAIVPMVLYNGESLWTAKSDFKQAQAGYEHFGEYLVNFKYVLFDVHRYNDADLLKEANVIASVFFMDKRISLSEAVARLKTLAKAVLKRFSPDELIWFMEWMDHVFKPRLPIAIQEKISRMLLKVSPQEVENVVSNLGLAVEEFERDTEIRVKLEVARKLLLRKVDVNTIRDSTGLTPSEIEELNKEIQH